MSKIYRYLVNVGDNDHLEVYARDLTDLEKIVDSKGFLNGFDRFMINSVTRGEIKKS